MTVSAIYIVTEIAKFALITVCALLDINPWLYIIYTDDARQEQIYILIALVAISTIIGLISFAIIMKNKKHGVIDAALCSFTLDSFSGTIIYALYNICFHSWTSIELILHMIPIVMTNLSALWISAGTFLLAHKIYLRNQKTRKEK